MKYTPLKNSPNLTGVRDQYPMVRTGSILMVETPDHGFAAISETSGRGEWRRYKPPAGQTATWIAGADVLSFMMKGDTITEIAAFSAETDQWATQKLLKPATEQISPVIGPGCALFQEGNNFYAFSAPKGAWDVLSLPEGEKPVASLSGTDVIVQQGDTIHVFPIKLGKWSQGIQGKPSIRPAQPQSQPQPQPQPRPEPQPQPQPGIRP